MNHPLGYIHQPLACYRIHGANKSNEAGFMIKGMFQTARKHLNMGSFKNKTMKKMIIVIRLTWNLLVSRLKKRSRKISKRSE
jgi:hypothetical protein